MKRCLTIAGSDCSGGAGIQADLKSFAANGVYGAGVITSVVAENTSRVISVFNLPAEEIEKQIDAVFEDIEIDAVKLGMLPAAEIVQTVGEKLKKYKPRFIVCDPVLVATSGDTLSGNEVISAYKKHIFPIADLITPNIPEAEAISEIRINDISDMKKAAEKIHNMNVKNVLVKGGHLNDEAVDILFDGNEFYTLKSKRINSPNTHGTGCTLSSAIAANSAKGLDMKNAVKQAKDYISQAIENSYTVGKGHSPVNHFYDYYKMKGTDQYEKL